MEQHANRWGPKELYPTIPTRVYLEKRTKARPGYTSSETNLSAGFNTPTATWGKIPSVRDQQDLTGRQEWIEDETSDPEVEFFSTRASHSNTRNNKRQESDDTPLKFNSERMFNSRIRDNKQKSIKSTTHNHEKERIIGPRMVDVVEPTIYVRLPAEDNEFRFPPIRRGEFGYHVAVRKDPTVRQLNFDSDEWN